MTSFDSRPQSFTHSQPQVSHYASMADQHLAPPMGSFRSFGETNGQTQPASNNGPAQIYTAVYSSIAVYEMEVAGISVMRRRTDSWLNATQILKVAGVDKGKRTKILEKEILNGEHEKIQGGYGKYQGTWINFDRGRKFCRQYGVEEVLRPLLDFDVSADGSGIPGHQDTPTKEQALAANRKRFYNSGVSSHMNGQGAAGTFFQNISPTASNALAAMNKAARFESPLARPGSAQKRPSNSNRRSSSHQQQQIGHDHLASSQQSMHSFVSDHNMDGHDSTYGSLGNTAREVERLNEYPEPPRKRLRPSSNQDPNHNIEPSLRDITPTEANESFHFPREGEHGPLSLPPLSSPTDKAGEEKRLALLDLFADPSRTDFSSHTAILHLSGQDLDIPLDTSANTALHWAATLARVSLMKLLIAKGANIFRGNAAGQTPLMAAVQVNNSLDHSCFPEFLEILGPLIEIRDTTGRTVLHHIAISSGIKGRNASSRYYLDSLLEFTVRKGSSSNPNSQQTSFDYSIVNRQRLRPISLVRFMSEVVNARDKSGNTALNLVARIGNRVIIHQLEEVGADFTIGNNTGFKPTDFGVYPRGHQNTVGMDPSSQEISASENKTQSQIEQIKEEIIATTTSILSQTQTQYQSELGKRQALIDQQNAELREIATQHKAELERLDLLQARARERSMRQHRIENLRYFMEAQQSENQMGGPRPPGGPFLIDPESLPSTENIGDVTEAQQAYLDSLPSCGELRARLTAYNEKNTALAAHVASLKSRSMELEAQYRRVISLSAEIDEHKVDEVLEGLLAAVESEEVSHAGADGTIEVGRVRDFLRKVEGAGVVS